MIREQALTLAVTFQVAHLVQHLSRTGQVNDKDLTVLLSSITMTSPDNTLEVYGGSLSNIKLGLELLVTHLGGKSQQKDPEFTRYIVSLLNLERQLNKKPKQLNLLGERIHQTKRQLEHFEITSDILLASFASIYSDIISPIGTRIQVAGDPAILKQSIIQHKIRSLLLSGVRAAVLWRQVGGQRRKILFGRKQLVACAKQILKEI
jgi:high frequency lysogenization protein